MADFNDSAELVDLGDIEVPEVVNPSNQSNQIVNFISLHSDNLPSLGSSTNADNLAAVVDLYKSYNEKYGFEVDFNIEDLNKNFHTLVNPRNRKIFELYLSECFGINRLVFYQRGLLVINSLMQQISSPAQLNDPSITIETKFQLLNQMLSLMQQFNDMFNDIKISDVDIQLKNIGKSETTVGDKSLSNSPDILKVMEQLSNTVLKQNNSENKQD